ncbi:hypothetical protein SH467x_002272 [Pirellulaceae bacterium SH467]
MFTRRTLAQRYVSYAIAALLIIAAVLGLLYNASSLSAAFSGAFDKVPDIAALPHFYTAFYLMSAICIVCYLFIIVASVGLCLGSATCARLLAILLLFEVFYFFAIGALWTLPIVGPGIGAATGVANGGLMVQFLLLMPIWIPVVFAFLGLYRQNPVPTAGSPTAPMPDGG